jgi:phage virion morphogenesis protein
MDDLSDLTDWAGALLQRLQPAERRRLTIELARDLRRQQARNMQAQQDPEGRAWTPRKAPTELRSARLRIRAEARAREPMFSRLRGSRWLKARGTANEAVVQFIGRAERIARVHHFGETDQVKPGGPSYDYPARPLLGVTDADRDRLRDIVLRHVGSH